MTFESKYESFRSAERRIEGSIPLKSLHRLSHMWRDGRCIYCDKAHNPVRVGEKCEARTDD